MTVLLLVVIAIAMVEAAGALLYRRLPSDRRRFLEYVLGGRAAAHDAGDQRASQASPVRFAEHPFLGFTLNSEFVNAAGERIHNRFGFRDSRDLAPPSPGELRIYLAGGSTVYDSAVESNDQTFAVRLESVLSNWLQRRVRVINGGVGNFTSLQSFIRLASWIDCLQPGLVVTYQGINDITPFLYTDEGPEAMVPDYAHSFRSLHLAELRRRVPRWARVSRAGRFWFGRTLDRRSLNIRFLTMKGPARVHHIGGDVDFAVSYIRQRIRYDMIETHLRNTIAVCTARRIPVVMITERLEPGSDEWYRPFLEEINDRIRRLAAAGGCAVIDFARDFPSDGRYFSGSMHFTEEGNRARAEWIARALVPHVPSKESSGVPA